MSANTSERLVLAGERKSGQSVRSENVTAVSAIANIVKECLRQHCYMSINTLVTLFLDAIFVTMLIYGLRWLYKL